MGMEPNGNSIDLNVASKLAEIQAIISEFTVAASAIESAVQQIQATYIALSNLAATSSTVHSDTGYSVTRKPE